MNKKTLIILAVLSGLQMHGCYPVVTRNANLDTPSSIELPHFVLGSQVSHDYIMIKLTDDLIVRLYHNGAWQDGTWLGNRQKEKSVFLLSQNYYMPTPWKWAIFTPRSFLGKSNLFEVEGRFVTTHGMCAVRLEFLTNVPETTFTIRPGIEVKWHTSWPAHGCDGVVALSYD